MAKRDTSAQSARHKCPQVGHLQSMCKGEKPKDGGNSGGGSGGNFGGGSGGGSSGSSGGVNTPEVGQFDQFYCEAMILSVEGVGSERKWMGDTGSSHHLKGDERKSVCSTFTIVRMG